MAVCLFVTYGYAGVTLDRIVREAGGSKTNIYAFYGGKEGLFLAAVESALAEVLRPLTQADVAGLTLAEGLRRLGRALVDALLTPRALALHRTLIGESGRFPRLGAAWYAAGPATSHRVLADFIAAALAGRNHRSLGDAGPDDVARLAQLFHDMVASDLQHRALVEPRPAGEAERVATVDAAVRAIVALVGRG